MVTKAPSLPQYNSKARDCSVQIGTRNLAMTALPMNGMTFVDNGVHTHINTPKMAPIAPTTLYTPTVPTPVLVE